LSTAQFVTIEQQWQIRLNLDGELSLRAGIQKESQKFIKDFY